MKKINLIGQKFEKLTVISAAENIKPKNNGRSFTAWNCQCECGKIITVRSGTLISHKQKSCGCIVSKTGFSIKPGEKFNNLITLSYEEGYWNCLCDCGKPTYVSTNHLICGNTKSCGCLKTETSKNNIKKALYSITKYSPTIASARRYWKIYQDKCDLTFDQWFKLSQQNCYYCGALPSNKYKSQYVKDNGDFIYNGLDKIDYNLQYTISNTITCCSICNAAKSNRSQKEFYNYINSIMIDYTINVTTTQLPIGYIRVSINKVYKNYSQIGIDLQTFYTYSQQPCIYCGMEKSNLCNVYSNDKKATKQAKEGAKFYYNGIDCLNIVPCCKYCSAAKNKLSIQEFQDWIIRIKDFNGR